jgi:Mlc titration factor MtfA (ptsG expression regulator)
LFGLRKKWRRKIRSRPFPRAWLEILERNVAYYHWLTPEDQAELRGHIQVFLDEKTFEGCGGLEIDDEIRVIIASQACLLLLHRDTDYYPTLRSIMVYIITFPRKPGGFQAA